MSKKLEILKASLQKKEAEFERRISEHFATVKQANGQPLNDKRNGAATLKKWERQNNAIRNLQLSIEATKIAIENEESKIYGCENADIPIEIRELLNSGVLIQWRKHPTTFFVNGVEKARICWDWKKKLVSHKYYSSIEGVELKQKFAKIYNMLNSKLNKK